MNIHEAKLQHYNKMTYLMKDIRHILNRIETYRYKKH